MVKFTTRSVTMEKTSVRYESPAGPLECVFLGTALIGVSIGQPDGGSLPRSEPLSGPKVMPAAARRLVKQLDAYFNGAADPFDVPVGFPEGTEFEKKVWLALKQIPRGRVRSYQWLAARVGRPRAARAVGRALGRNPLLIILPCHRVVRSDGSLGGFSCGLDIKRKLLELEGVESTGLQSRRRGSTGRSPA